MVTISCFVYLLFHAIKSSTFLCRADRECQYSEFTCDPSEACNLECTENLSCQYATLYGPKGYPVIVKCSSGSLSSDNYACRGLIIHAENASSVDIASVYSYDLSYAVIYSPVGPDIHSPSTFIKCLRSTACLEFTVFAQEGSKDVQIHCTDYSNCLLPNNAIAIHCGIPPYPYRCPNSNLMYNTSTGLYICDPLQSTCNTYSMPTPNPTVSPSGSTNDPTFRPTVSPTPSPTDPTNDPTYDPSHSPTFRPTLPPTLTTRNPTKRPTAIPTISPTRLPSKPPTLKPTMDPTNATENPSASPTQLPTSYPTKIPSNTPTVSPTHYPTEFYTQSPTFTSTNKYPIDTDVVEEAQSNSTDGLNSTTTTIIIAVSIVAGICICCIAFVILGFAMLNRYWKHKVLQTQDHTKSSKESKHNVAAKLAELADFNQGGTANGSAPSAPWSASTDEQNGLCYLCCEVQGNIFNYPCGHVTYCNQCIDENQDRIDRELKDCPCCRQNVQEFKRIHPAGFQN